MDILELANNIEKVKNNIKAVCENCGRENDVLLVGASKTMEQEVIDYVDSNRLLQVLGENKVQELTLKYRDNQSLDWHFIGRLQKNKVKYIIDKVKLIHSVDSVDLAKEIDKQAKKHNLIMPCLIQINMGREESKTGFFLEDATDAIEEISKFDNVKIDGLMAVMPIESESETIKLYKRLNEEYTLLKQKYNFKFLSAGMTNDYLLAIEYANSNIVRIGTAIFGKRSYNEKV